MAVTDRGQNEPNARGISASFRARPKAELRNTHNLQDNMSLSAAVHSPAAGGISVSSENQQCSESRKDA
jgi:hypothetical protein